MRIYRMTATFGKLEHETLTLEPGLNVIQAPNEWGKSTWCAFLAAMLYGLDTRAKSTKTALADKERYVPWSGNPMAGRIDLCWNGRDITIERRTKGRVPMGVFRAYETASGLEIPELTAANCGAVLLGVEQSVFRRAGFIRQADMPVTQDEALRRRLNDLVTTGDETGDADRLAKELKELKNRCRYNRTGLIPQAEEEQRQLEEKLSQRQSVELHAKRLKQRLGEEKSWFRELENHRVAMAYAKAEADAQRIAEAREARDQAERQLAELELACAKLPSRVDAQAKTEALRQFREDWGALQRELAAQGKAPEAPAVPEPFQNRSPEQTEAMLTEDTRQWEQLAHIRSWLPLGLLAGAFLLLAIPMAVQRQFLGMALALGIGAVLLLLCLRKKRRQQDRQHVLEIKYASRDPRQWRMQWEMCRKQLEEYRRAMEAFQKDGGALALRREALEKQQQALCGSQSADTVLELWQQVLRRWDAREGAVLELQQREKHLKILQTMAKTAPAPAMEDALTYSEAETDRLIADAQEEQQRLLSRLGQYQGRMEALGDDGLLEQQLEAVNRRLQKLEETEAALTLALDTLTQARLELQRRFAPRIASRAQELLTKMTGGRYDRLALREDLSLLAGAGSEETLREVLWRSDGTVDQLYLSLRLAVAEELMPQAPLVLDDVFVRFDDARMTAAMEILRQEAEQKQVILFTCQSRESRAV